MEQEISKKLSELEVKIDRIYRSVEKTRKYIVWKMIITFVLVVLPIIGLIFALPSFISSYTDTVKSLGL